MAAEFLAVIVRDPSGASWPDALDRLAAAHRSQWSQIHIDDGDYAAARLSVTGRNSDFSVQSRLIAGGYHVLDPRPQLLNSLDGEVRACWQLMNAEAFDGSAFVNEFLDRRENDLRWAMGAGTQLSTGSRLIFGVSRARNDGAFETGEIEQLNFLSAKLVPIIELHDRLRAAERMATTLANAPGDDSALLAIDRRGRLAFANARGSALLETAHVTQASDGVLRFSDGRVQAVLETALKRSDDGGPLTALAGDMALTFRTVPALSRGLAGDLAPVRVLIEGRPQAGALADRQLSKREREVAELLVRGVGIAEIARELGKSIETVRAQLKSAMRKMGVHSQAQLVSRLLGKRS